MCICNGSSTNPWHIRSYFFGYSSPAYTPLIPGGLNVSRLIKITGAFGENPLAEKPLAHRAAFLLRSSSWHTIRWRCDIIRRVGRGWTASLISQGKKFTTVCNTLRQCSISFSQCSPQKLPRTENHKNRDIQVTMEGKGSNAANMATNHQGHTKTSHEGAHESSPVGMALVYVPIMVLAGCALIVFLYRVWSDFMNNQRLKFAIYQDCKVSFNRPSRAKTWLNRHLLYAPLFERRHNREFRICRGHINMGKIPTRLETLLLACYVALNGLFCVVVIDWSQPISQSLHSLIGTTGTLAIVNLIPLVITAGRNNPLIKVLRVSFDTFNLVHRWLGRIVVAEAVAHTVGILVRVGIWSK